MFMIDVVGVKHLQARLLELTFEDGLTAVVDMDRIISSYDFVFSELQNLDYFRQVRVDKETGTIDWPNGADICPDVLYSFASGKPIIIQGERVLN